MTLGKRTFDEVTDFSQDAPLTKDMKLENDVKLEYSKYEQTLTSSNNTYDVTKLNPATVNIYDTIRLVINSHLIDLVGPRIEDISKEDNVIIIIPESNNNTRDIFIILKESTRGNEGSFASKVVDSNAIKRLANSAARIGILIQSGLVLSPTKKIADVSECTKLDLLLHTAQAGHLIGPGGSTIRELRVKFSCEFDIERNMLPGSVDRYFHIMGESTQIYKDIEIVLELLRESDVDKKIKSTDRFFNSGKKAETLTDNISSKYDAFLAEQIPDIPVCNDKSKLRFLCDEEVIYHIIGKGGCTIRKLREDHPSCDIKIYDKYSCDKIVEITTSDGFENILTCLAEIFENTKRSFVHSSGKKQDSDQFHFRMLKHSIKMGALFGKHGARLKALKECTSVLLLVYREFCPDSTDRVLRLTGSAEEILEIIKVVNIIFYMKNIEGHERFYRGQIMNPVGLDGRNYGGFCGIGRNQFRNNGYAGPGGFIQGSFGYNNYNNQMGMNYGGMNMGMNYGGMNMGMNPMGMNNMGMNNMGMNQSKSARPNPNNPINYNNMGNMNNWQNKTNGFQSLNNTSNATANVNSTEPPTSFSTDDINQKM